MKNDETTVEPKARPAMPDAANRPKTAVSGMDKTNHRMEPVLKPDEEPLAGTPEHGKE